MHCGWKGLSLVSIVPLNRSRVKEHLKERRFGLWKRSDLKLTNTYKGKELQINMHLKRSRGLVCVGKQQKSHPF